MGEIKTFKDIVVWQKSHNLALTVYELTDIFPKSELFGLISQMRRAAVSIPSNIAEGFTRKNLKDRMHFYNIAQSSLEELKYQLLLAKDLRYITEEKYMSSLALAEEVGAMLHGWKKSQKF